MNTPLRSAPGEFISTACSRATLAEIWQIRWLVIQLIRRDLTVRYRQTWLGWLWALLNPALNLAMYYTVFGLLIRVATPEYHAPYAFVLLSGLVLWMLFAATLNAVSETLLNHLHLIQKIWFPRTALTLAAAGVSLVDFLLALMLLGGLLFLTGHAWPLHDLPMLILCGGITALCAWGFGSLLAILRLRFRDLRHLIPLMVQALFYATPVVWTPGMLSPAWQHVMALNPLTGVLALFRHILLGGPPPSEAMLLLSSVGALLLAAVGGLAFSRFEARVVDRE